MSRESYTACITPKMRAFPKGIPRAERNILFCQAAKVCAGKARSDQEALAICKAQPPKPPKERKPRGKKGGAECPVFDATTLIPKCEIKLKKMQTSGELPVDLDIEGVCRLILG